MYRLRRCKCSWMEVSVVLADGVSLTAAILTKTDEHRKLFVFQLVRDSVFVMLVGYFPRPLMVPCTCE